MSDITSVPYVGQELMLVKVKGLLKLGVQLGSWHQIVGATRASNVQCTCMYGSVGCETRPPDAHVGPQPPPPPSSPNALAICLQFCCTASQSGELCDLIELVPASLMWATPS